MKILLFDDHRLFGESLKKLLIESQFVSLCYYVERENDFFRTFREKEFDIILLDINLKNSSEKNGFEILADILSINPDSKVVILSSYDMPIYKKMAFDKGAADFINKSVSMEELVERLKRVLCNKTYYNKIPDIEVLTEREIEILRAICKGDIKKKIAKNLFISERTLYNHIQNIYDKLEVSNIVEAYNKAIKLGYIEPLM